ncbi:hypothetical protein [Streptomyces sp. NPDC087294]|uniref:hypothetical protein n=1 Tax=Streptomyces sp. NPDC087294 TaxID=3365777 RepID=UPI003817A8E0
MTRYRIDRSCGHQETVELFGGSSRDRDRRAEREEDRSCHACWQEQRDREREQERLAAAEAAEREGLPGLQGSSKQIDWALTLRHDLLARLEEHVEELRRTERDRQDRAWQYDGTAPDGDGGAGRAERVHRAAARAARKVQAGRTALEAVREVSAARWFIDHGSTPPDELVAMAARGDLAPRTPEQKAAGFDPHGYSAFTVPRDEVEFAGDGDAVVTLRGSRWEGCVFTHPAALATVREEAGGTVVELRFHGDWGFVVSDGRRKGRVPAREMHADRTAGRREEAGPRYFLLPSPWRPDAWNEIDVPEGDITEAFDVFGDCLTGHVRVMLRCSRWEGLYLHHSRRLVVRHRPGYVTLLVPPSMPHLRLHGGAGKTVVPAGELAEDRARPLEGPGQSLAVPQERWHRVVFDSSRVREVKDASMVRFGWESQDPKAVVFHRGTMCRALKDGAVEWRFPDGWEFRLRLPEGGARVLSAAEFVEATADWARTEPAPGTHQRVPDLLDPVVPEIDPDLLDDDVDLPEEWGIDADDEDPAQDPAQDPDEDLGDAGAAGHGAYGQERNADR